MKNFTKTLQNYITLWCNVSLHKMYWANIVITRKLPCMHYGYTAGVIFKEAFNARNEYNKNLLGSSKFIFYYYYHY